MQVKKLYTVGDGYAHNHYWPMWSELLADVLDCPWTNLSAIGAGNEYIANSVIDALSVATDLNDSLWIIQWSSPKRLDLRINEENTHFIDCIKTDKVYHSNFSTTEQNQTYWVSSASELEQVIKHNDFITTPQHITRSRNLQLSTAYALDHYGVEWRYMFTYDAPWARNNIIPDSKYIWESQKTFRDKSVYRDLDVGEIQPVSSIHLDFLEQFVLPYYEFGPAKLDAVKQHVVQQDQTRKLTRSKGQAHYQ
jgi:hypothetical protein